MRKRGAEIIAPPPVVLDATLDAVIQTLGQAEKE